MMGKARFRTLRGQVALLSALSLCGALAVFLTTFLLLRTVQVGGPVYAQITAAKDLEADVLPPALYSAEGELLVLRISQEQNPERRAELVRQVEAERRRLEESARDWAQRVHDPSIRDALEQTRLTALAFLEAGGKEMPSAVDDGDAMRALSALERANAAFLVHRQAARRLAGLVRAHADAMERAAASTTRARIVTVVVLLLAFAVIAGLAARALARGVTRGIERLCHQSKRLTDAVERGDLDLRGDAAAMIEEFKPVVDGMNAAMEAFVRPVRLSTEIATCFAQGSIPPMIVDDARGEFERMKENWNSVIEMTTRRGQDMQRLMAAAREGRLAERADPSQYPGYNGKLIEAMNGILDAVGAPIRESVDALERLAHGDLLARMTGEYPGDFARMKEGLNRTAQALDDAMERVASTTERVSSAASQIAASSQSVAAGASQQARSLEATSSSLESMTTMVKSAADSAQQASALAQTARGAAGEGSSAVERVTDSMSKIRASAEATSQIIKDINEIAFQTNLLALNAAVEAARAGEAGRGFAVVAEEVRGLAMRAKEAARKTEALILESVRQTGEGDATAKLATAQLAQITSAVEKVTEVVADIAASAREQATSIDEVTDAVEQVNAVTQQNATSSKESSSAAVELSSQAEELTALVGAFRFRGQVSGSGARPAAGPPPGAGERTESHRAV